MEPETENNFSPIPATTKRTTTWNTIHGSLDDTVTVESSLSPEINPDSIAPGRSPLVLRRPGSGNTPCEITIYYTQQHEVRQIYVKSTARVYEVYYATKSNRSNEYLCTVRCGMAAKVEAPEVSKGYEVLQTTDVEGSVNQSCNDDNRCLSAAESRTNSGSSSVEDGWVEVKVPSSSWMHNEDGSPPNDISLEKCSQDFYEATAEISEADPCVSLTLRLLSIQSGKSVYIDEVYIFADAVAPDDMEQPPTSSGNSAGNALMSLLVPTLLQLSRSQTSRIQDGLCPPAAAERVGHDCGVEIIGSAVASSDIPPERVPNPSGESKATLEKENGDFTVNPTQIVDLKQSLVHEKSPACNSGADNFSGSHLEKTLNELVSRVSKIEDLCLRFENNMLKPLISMEARLEKVEQKLESFMKDSRPSAPTSCIRISAPEFSCSGSACSSFYADGNNNGSALPDSMNQKLESFTKDSLTSPPTSCVRILAPEFSCSWSESSSFYADGDNHGSALPDFKNHNSGDESSALHCDMATSGNGTNLLPGLVVTAPDFSSFDDVEKDVIDAPADLPKSNSKKILSIDDALVSALAGFLSSTSTSSVVSSQVPDGAPVNFLTEEWDFDGDEKNSTEVSGNEPSVLLIHQNDTNKTNIMKSLVLPSDDESDKIAEFGSDIPVASHNSEDSEEIVYGGDSLLAGKLFDSDIVSEPEKAQKTTTEAQPSGEEVEARESGIEISENFASNYTDAESNLVSDAAYEAAFDERVSPSKKEVTEEATDFWRTLSRSPSPPVGFDGSILDVEFLRQDHPESLEAFLHELQESDINAASTASTEDKNDEDRACVASLLANVEDHESAAPFALHHQLLDFDYCGSIDSPLYISGGDLRNSDVHCDQEAILSLI